MMKVVFTLSSLILIGRSLSVALVFSRPKSLAADVFLIAGMTFFDADGILSNIDYVLAAAQPLRRCCVPEISLAGIHIAGGTMTGRPGDCW